MDWWFKSAIQRISPAWLELTSAVSKPQASILLSKEFHESNGPETMTGTHVGGTNCKKNPVNLIYPLGLQ